MKEVLMLALMGLMFFFATRANGTPRFAKIKAGRKPDGRKVVGPV